MNDLLKDVNAEKNCPKCGSEFTEPVKYTWWGGMLGPKILHHTKCNECGYRFNSKTRQSNKTGIIIYTIVSFAIALTIILALRFGLR